MNSNTENLSPQQSLEIITSMIREAQGKVRKNSFYFILWGWVVAVANLGMFILIQIDFNRPYIIWIITIPTWIFTLYRSFSDRQSTTTVTHFDKISGALWLCFGIAVFTVVAFGFKINYQLNPVILIMSSIPTFASGIILKFRPLLFGGIIFWISGITCFFLPLEFQSLAAAIAIFFGYIVPGYYLRNTND